MATHTSRSTTSWNPTRCAVRSPPVRYRSPPQQLSWRLSPYSRQGEGPRMTETTERRPRTARPRRVRARAVARTRCCCPSSSSSPAGSASRPRGMRKGDLIDAIKAAQGGAASELPGDAKRRQSAQAGGPDTGAPAGRAERQDDRPEQAQQGTVDDRPRRGEPAADAGQRDHDRADRAGQPGRTAGRRSDRRATTGRRTIARATTGRGTTGRQRPSERPTEPTAATGSRTTGSRRSRAATTTRNDDRRTRATTATRTATRTEPGRNRANDRRRRRRRQPPQPPPSRPRPQRPAPTGRRQQPGRPTAATATSPTCRSSRTTSSRPCAGILDVLDNYAFVRTSGYLPGTDDVYVVAVDGPQVRPASRRRGHRPGAPAPRGRAQGEVQPAGASSTRSTVPTPRRRRRASSSASSPRSTPPSDCAWRPRRPT